MANKKTAKKTGKPSTSAQPKKLPPKKGEEVPSSKREVKLRKLRIQNFKAFEDIELRFPGPEMNDEPDVIVMGSKNGLGKTSVLEACSLLFIAAAVGKHLFEEARQIFRRQINIDIPELLIRAGADLTRIQGHFSIEGSMPPFKKSGVIEPITLTLHRNGKMELEGGSESLQSKERGFPDDMLFGQWVESLLGTSPDPLLFRSLLYFHSYRKVQEGSPELGMMVDRPLPPRRFYRNEKPAISAFKITILRLLMGKAELFEFMEYEQPEKALEILNDLIEKYAGGKIDKLRPSPDNTIEFRITPQNGKQSFSFDGLSSGQKEIISTLFLIWHNTHQSPSLVLIDEPELHMNAGWQLGFIQTLQKLAPENQYIIATHSEDIASSVDPSRRILLNPD